MAKAMSAIKMRTVMAFLIVKKPVIIHPIRLTVMVTVHRIILIPIPMVTVLMMQPRQVVIQITMESLTISTMMLTMMV